MLQIIFSWLVNDISFGLHRSKTDEELTAEREAKMRKLEEERRLRMLMDQEEGERKPKHQSADALDDEYGCGFCLLKLKKWIRLVFVFYLISKPMCWWSKITARR